jgi:MFS family permease
MPGANVKTLLDRFSPARIVAVATFFFFVGAIGTRPLVSLHGATLGVGPAELGVLVALFALIPVMFTTIYGRWLDTHGCVRAMLASIAIAVIGLFLPVLFPGREGLYLSQLVAGSGFTAYVLAAQKYVGQNSADLWARERNVAIFAMGVAVGSLVGPLVAGATADFAGFLTAFAWLAGVGLIALVILVPLLASDGAAARAKPKPAAGAPGPRSPLRVFGYNPYLGRAFLISALILMGKDMYIAYFPLYGVEVGLSATAIGAIIALHNAGGVVMRFFMLPLVRVVGKNRVVVWSVVASGAVFLLMPMSGDVWMLAFLSLAVGLGLGVGQPLAITTTMNLSPPDKVGEVLGFRLMLNRTTQFVAPLGFAGASLLTGVAGTFVILGAVLLAGSTRLTIPADAEAQADAKGRAGEKPEDQSRTT